MDEPLEREVEACERRLAWQARAARRRLWAAGSTLVVAVVLAVALVPIGPGLAARASHHAARAWQAVVLDRHAAPARGGRANE